MSSLEEDIERRIARSIADWQKTVTRQGPPLDIDTAWLQTPEALRTPFQVLKTAGIPPREVELFQQRARLREALAAAGSADEQQRLQRELSELEQALNCRLEALRRMAGG